jgi:hypothetical protein
VIAQPTVTLMLAVGDIMPGTLPIMLAVKMKSRRCR